MAQNNKLLVLKISLIVFSVLALIYGIAHLFVPKSLVDLSGGEPVPSGWLRWSGGVLIGLGIGAILAFRDLKKQGTLVLTLAFGTLLAGLALLHTLFFEIAVDVWFVALAAIMTLVSSALLWWGWFQLKGTLKREKSD